MERFKAYFYRLVIFGQFILILVIAWDKAVAQENEKARATASLAQELSSRTMPITKYNDEGDEDLFDENDEDPIDCESGSMRQVSQELIDAIINDKCK